MTRLTLRKVLFGIGIFFQICIFLLADGLIWSVATTCFLLAAIPVNIIAAMRRLRVTTRLPRPR